MIQDRFKLRPIVGQPGFVPFLEQLLDLKPVIPRSPPVDLLLAGVGAVERPPVPVVDLAYPITAGAQEPLFDRAGPVVLVGLFVPNLGRRFDFLHCTIFG